MYTTLYNVTVHPIQGDPVEFVDSNDTPGAGSAVLAQLTANKDVDSAVEGGDGVHVIIPLHAVDYAEVTEQRTESEYEDDNAKNCVIPDSGETGDFTITNSTDSTVRLSMLASAALNGQYGDVIFSTDSGEDPLPEGYQSFAVVSVPASDVGEPVLIRGVPVGTTFAFSQGGDPEMVVMGTAPGTYTYTGQQH